MTNETRHPTGNHPGNHHGNSDGSGARGGAPGRVPIGSRPAPTAATAWVRQGSNAPSIYTARLTVDVTPALRGRIKIAAYRRGVTAAAMLRELLEREYPERAP
ncbi:ribbon-helix-helix domain-containing protein [Achromobacter xylosoxidans]|jgi:hypothetical protein|uniref:ribbon-helix-helix domain-containing protein n=1 Tax=Alcaligenes xylosoxydans xylosoxydans TaxID=85698 RepID=UPI001F12E15B|nr:ribbon-helix-helix domain-containing protein [Achromobacter xylosoxidans]